jgi:2-polyprenyl-3-methyl-5-hydroxy-6-metoxy-1,4-benzoquinol methylase
LPQHPGRPDRRPQRSSQRPPARQGPERPRPAPSRETRVKPTDWSDVAEWYDNLVGKEGSEYQREVVHPNLLRVLGPVTGKRILDVACGQGVLCRLLHEAGALVTGLDAAAPLLELARQHGPAEIRYERVDARDLIGAPGFAPGSYDFLTCVLAIQNFHPIRPLFDAAAKLLTPTGRLAVVMMHPCFRMPHHASWGWDSHKEVQFRRVDRYLTPYKQPIVTSPGKRDGKYTWTFHRPIEAYATHALRAGLVIDALEEWESHKQSEPGPRSAGENLARREIPMFMCMGFHRAAISVDEAAKRTRRIDG